MGRLIFTPRASITSAEPHLELRLRLPCLATRTPAPATTNAVAVEILKVPRASPPVPQVSTSASRPVPLTVQRGVLVKGQRLGRGAHGLGEADDLFHRLALHVESDQQGRNLSVRGAAGEHLRHDGARFFAGERFSFIGNALQGFGDHEMATRVASFADTGGPPRAQTSIWHALTESPNALLLTPDPSRPAGRSG